MGNKHVFSFTEGNTSKSLYYNLNGTYTWRVISYINNKDQFFDIDVDIDVKITISSQKEVFLDNNHVILYRDTLSKINLIEKTVTRYSTLYDKPYLIDFDW